MPVDPLSRKLCHITHIRNLSSIISEGCLWSHRESIRRELTIRDIGRLDLKRERDTVPVVRGPGGMIGDYVPFFFCPRPVMLLLLATGRVEGYSEGEEPIVHLISDIGNVVRSKQPFVFTDGHAVKKLSNQYMDLYDLNRLDWAVIRDHQWADTVEDNDRMRRKQAEFLVYQRLPWDCISAIGVRSERMEEEVRNVLANAQHRPETILVL